MSKELEALLDKLTTEQIAIDLFNIVSNGKYNMNDLVYYFNRIDDDLTELEELKRDVKRFMELKNNITNREEMDEFWEIDNKLSKVGKAE